MTREINASQRDWLLGELSAWRAQGLIDAAQEQAVLGLYPTPEQMGERTQARALRLLASLAAVLMGLAVLLLIAANWERIPAAGKISLILASLIAVHGLGFYLRFEKGRPVAADVAALLGCFIYGAGIWLIAQIFHLTANDGAAWWWWAVGTLPFALISENLALHAMVAALLAAWIGVEVLGFGNLGAWLFGRWPRLPNLAPSLLVMIAPGLAWAYRRREPRAVLLYVCLLAWWAVLLPLAWPGFSLSVEFVGAVGATLLLAAEMHRAGSPMGMPYRILGAGLVAGALIPLSFYEWHSAIGPIQPLNPNPGAIFPLAALETVVLGLGSLAVALALSRRHAGSSAAPVETVMQILERNWLPFSIMALMTVLVWYGPTLAQVSGPWPPTIAANLAMVALAFWLIRLGLIEDRGRPFIAGVIYFLVWTVLRYIDLFGNFGGMLGAAGLFFLCGVALFLVAQYWRNRRVHARPTVHPPEVPHEYVF